jgi:hypothetical protein
MNLQDLFCFNSRYRSELDQSTQPSLALINCAAIALTAHTGDSRPGYDGLGGYVRLRQGRVGWRVRPGGAGRVPYSLFCIGDASTRMP